MNCLSPSILSADYANLGEQIRLLDQAGAEICTHRCYGWNVCSEYFVCISDHSFHS